LTKIAGRSILVIIPKSYNSQGERKIANNLRIDEAVHNKLENSKKNLRMHQNKLCSYNLMFKQKLRRVIKVQGGYKVEFRMFSTDIKKDKCVPLDLISNLVVEKPLLTTTVSKELVCIKSVPTALVLYGCL
jgi:thioredoxin-related protein